MNHSKIFTLITALSLIISLFISFQSSYCEGSSIIIENFNNYSNNLFKHWLLRKGTPKKASKVYKIKSESNNRYLHASTRGNPGIALSLAKQVKWNCRSYPFLRWRWRIHKLPTGANETNRQKNDSAAAIYVIFQRSYIPFLSRNYQPVNVIKYVWSSSLPRGKIIHTKIVKKMGIEIYDSKYIILQSGKKNSRKWITEKRNVLQDYMLLFGKEPRYNPIFIGIRTDSNSTKSIAIADYDDFVIMNY